MSSLRNRPNSARPAGTSGSIHQLKSIVAVSTGHEISSHLLSMRSANALLELPPTGNLIPAGTYVVAIIVSDIIGFSWSSSLPSSNSVCVTEQNGISTGIGTGKSEGFEYRVAILIVSDTVASGLGLDRSGRSCYGFYLGIFKKNPLEVWSNYKKTHLTRKLQKPPLFTMLMDIVQGGPSSSQDEAGCLIRAFRSACGCTTMVGPMNTELKQRKNVVHRKRARPIENEHPEEKNHPHFKYRGIC